MDLNDIMQRTLYVVDREVATISSLSSITNVNLFESPLCNKTTLFCLICVGYHSELRVAIIFYQHYHFMPTNLYHILHCA